jgi:hypothetical protein
MAHASIGNYLARVSGCAFAGGRGTTQTEPVAALLAGGLARRLGGGDKPPRALGGRPLLEHVLDRIRRQVRAVALSANGDPARYVLPRDSGQSV